MVAQCFDVRSAPAVFEELALIGAAGFLGPRVGFVPSLHAGAQVARALIALFVVASVRCRVLFRDATRATVHP